MLEAMVPKSTVAEHYILATVVFIASYKYGLMVLIAVFSFAYSL